MAQRSSLQGQPGSRRSTVGRRDQVDSDARPTDRGVHGADVGARTLLGVDRHDRQRPVGALVVVAQHQDVIVVDPAQRGDLPGPVVRHALSAQAGSASEEAEGHQVVAVEDAQREPAPVRGQSSPGGEVDAHRTPCQRKRRGRAARPWWARGQDLDLAARDDVGRTVVARDDRTISRDPLHLATESRSDDAGDRHEPRDRGAGPLPGLAPLPGEPRAGGRPGELLDEDAGVADELASPRSLARGQVEDADAGAGAVAAEADGAVGQPRAVR